MVCSAQQISRRRLCRRAMYKGDYALTGLYSLPAALLNASPRRVKGGIQSMDDDQLSRLNWGAPVIDDTESVDNSAIDWAYRMQQEAKKKRRSK